ncbi:TIGR03668 family PPOX class F420-dependent oxidoreductase [Pseudonocardia eucalypti]|uniref:TIGR03668 family PPOX class F420-dependent oxidoreductase n=1 Tax=Pseudonocardia eucalypti TaxID=648755 RepID=A0ABP9QYK9_9PSEU|nr:PPOX class probable F420-dependent enzyme [Pseudonocardia eucalypti]
MDEAHARRRFAAARVARLATVTPDGRPHLVPVTFALRGDRVAIAVDHKPKTTTNLKRLRNIRSNPNVSLLADEYDDDWSRLWWVRLDGQARIVLDGPERDDPLGWLTAKYPRYRERPPAGPMILVEVTGTTGWAFAG